MVNAWRIELMKTYLNIGGLEVDEEKIASDKTNGDSNSESEKP